MAKRGRQPAAAYREEEEEAGHRHFESRASRRDFQSHDVFSLLEVYQKLVLSASLKLAAFEPCHYTTMVCGRPVQVIMVFIIGMCRDVEFLLSMPPVFFGLSFSLTSWFRFSLPSLVYVRFLALCSPESSQVIVLCHEDARAEEWMPYFSARLHPARPIWFLGRASRRPPLCAPKSAVFHWFQDRCS